MRTVLVIPLPLFLKATGSAGRADGAAPAADAAAAQPGQPQHFAGRMLLSRRLGPKWKTGRHPPRT
jgi:hypothetical protein